MVISRISSSGRSNTASSSSSHPVIDTCTESLSIRRIVQQQYNHQPGIEQEKEEEGIRLKVLQQIIHAYA